MFTLLHISDLHRSQQDPIENETLLSSLLDDMDRYAVESPRLEKPDAAIVSGDVIQGVALGTPNYAEELDRQYEVANGFLSKMADRLFEGDRRRIVVLPGNHDVCWNTAFQAMTELVPENPSIKASLELFDADSDLRWSWKTRTIFQVKSSDLYKQRLAAYWRFVTQFYKDAKLKYSLSASKGYNLFELDNGRIVVVAFESVHGNDCFCSHGAIERSVLGRCSLEMRDLQLQPILRVAAWHHSLQGPPQASDYMNVTTIHEMIGSGFRLGLHGHQHKAEASAYYIHLPEEFSMALSSTGSLCAGLRELPQGTNREYNIVVIDDDYKSARVHVREMAQGNHFGKCGRGVFRVDGYVKLKWELPTGISGSPPVDEERYTSDLILKAEIALHDSRPHEALELLEKLKSPMSKYARTLFVQAARESGSFVKLINALGRPLSIHEFVEVFGAMLSENQFENAQALLDQCKAFALDSATVDSLQSKLNMQILMRKFQ